MFEKFVGISFWSWFIVSVTLILEEELVEFWRIAEKIYLKDSFYTRLKLYFIFVLLCILVI